MFERLDKELHAARPAFSLISPGMSNLISSQYPKAIKIIGVATFFKGWHGQRKAGMSYAQMIGSSAGYKITKKLTKPLKTQVINAHLHVQATEKRDFNRKNGLGGRTWYTKPGIHQLIIVFHDANRAGPHIDVHIGRLSLVYKVKPELYAKLKYNKDGILTANSQEMLLEYIKDEIETGARVPQNLDHSRSNAISSWTHGDRNATTYGSGFTRQVISASQVEVYKAHANGPIEMYAPALNSFRPLYLYRLYPGDGKRAPICIFGAKKSHVPKLKDRLHLKLIHPEDIDQLELKADMTTSTAKYDGSSCYFSIGPKGTRVWSPRISKVSGEQIEYTPKMRGLQGLHNKEEIVGMGEIVFVRKNWMNWRENGNIYLPQAQGSGILNSNGVLPRGVRPEIRIYRIDKIGKTDLTEAPFAENRVEQQRVAALHPSILKVVELMDPKTAHDKGFEGVVVVPEGQSVNEGFKVKWWTDPHDWVITKVSFKSGEKGKVAGVVHAKSLESGKDFKLGPGQMGNEALTRHMMQHPDAYEGAVLKVLSRHGHEGRASKVVSIHDDKGIAVLE